MKTNLIFPRSFFDNNMGQIDDEYLAILIIFILHKNKMINDDSLKAKCKQFNDKTLLRHVNTYHCKINDKWYSYGLLESYLDCYNLAHIKEITIEEFLSYSNRLLNKNRNYCVDYIYFNYIEPFINADIEHFNFKGFRELDVSKEKYLTFDEYCNTDQSSSGYCCGDCDGSYEEYKRNRYEYEHLGYNFKEKLENDIKHIFNNMKTESSFKNFGNRTSYL